jgi:hypothetical protein
LALDARIATRHDGFMHRVVVGEHPSENLRLWTSGDGPGYLEPDGLGVEWAGRGGHPSSYALLGGHLVADGQGGFDVHETGPYVNNLAWPADRVEFAILDAYTTLAGPALGGDVVITVAARGYEGSSSMAFMWVAHLLSALLREGVPSTDAGVLDLWRSIQNEHPPRAVQ